MKTLYESVNLEGKVAIVTGGAMGIGEGIARRLAEAGASVVIADMNTEVAQKMAESLGGLAVTTDVSDSEAVENMVAQTVERYGRVDILVNNAGIYPNKSVEEMDKAFFEKILSVNLTGVFLATKACTKQMVSQGDGGKIINITSIDALHPSMEGLSAYDASKHGLWGFTKTAALEFADNNIQVNAIAPGGISTPGTGADNTSEEMQRNIEAFKKLIPMGRMGDPDEIGKVALFLASDLSSYMTGSQIVVDGGRLLS